MLAWKAAAWPGVSVFAIAVALIAYFCPLLRRNHSQSDEDTEKLSIKGIRHL